MHDILRRPERLSIIGGRFVVGFFMQKKKVDPFYKTVRWQNLRGRVLARDGYQCQMNKRYGRSVMANTVHHVFPREDYPQFQWQAWNLISLSTGEHNKMHVRNSHELSDYGIELLRRVARKNNIPVPEEYL